MTANSIKTGDDNWYTDYKKVIIVDDSLRKRFLQSFCGCVMFPEYKRWRLKSCCTGLWHWQCSLHGREWCTSPNYCLSTHAWTSRTKLLEFFVMCTVYNVSTVEPKFHQRDKIQSDSVLHDSFYLLYIHVVFYNLLMLLCRLTNRSNIERPDVCTVIDGNGSTGCSRKMLLQFFVHILAMVLSFKSEFSRLFKHYY